MRIDPSSIYSKYQTEAKKAGNTRSGAKAAPASTYKEGDVIKGEIVDSNQSKVSIKLESGQTLEARLTSANSFSIGDSVSFVVKESGGEQLLITPMIQEGGQSTDQLMNILGEAGLPKTDENVELLKAMIDRQLPVDKESLKQMVRTAAKFPDAGAKDLTFFSKHQIPVSEGNIQQLQMLEDNQQPLMRSMASLVDDLSSAISSESMTGAGETPMQAGQLEQVLNSIVGDQEVMAFLETVDSSVSSLTTVSGEGAVEAVQGETGVIQTEQSAEGQVVKQQNDGQAVILHSGSADTGKAAAEVPLGHMLMARDIQVLDEKLTLLVQEDRVWEDGQTPSFLKEGFSLHNASVSEMMDWAEKGFIRSEDLGEIMQDVKEGATYQALAKGLLMSDIKTIEEGDVNEWFNEVQKKVQQIIDTTAEGQEAQAVAKGASDVKTAVNFLNDMQQDYNFMHIPMFLNDQLMNSELYVLNQTKGRRQEDQGITALIRLDLLNLGHTDIYVKKTSKNLDIQFYMTDETQMDVMRDNVFQLHKLLTNKGFNVLSATVQPLEDSFSVVDDFLEKSGQKTDTKRYSFDMKA